ncbi:MAG: Crp/Fnr family transcriptional regulator [Pseudomonadota bacterium]
MKPIAPEIEQLFATVAQFTDISKDARMAMARELTPMEFSKNQFLVHAGENNGDLFYIHQGLVRFFYSTEDGREFNKSFAAEGGFIGCLRSMLTLQPCRFSIQALEPTRTLVLSTKARKSLWNEFPEWDRLGRILAERLALKKEEREAQFLLDPVERRYQQFHNEHPCLSNRLAQYHIASYLGITDVALSRIRKRLNTA